MQVLQGNEKTACLAVVGDGGDSLEVVDEADKPKAEKNEDRHKYDGEPQELKQRERDDKIVEHQPLRVGASGDTNSNA